MRQRIGSVVCDGCSRLIDVNEPKCPYCDRASPGLWGYGPVLRQLVGDLSDLSRPIIIVCVTLYAIALLIDFPGAMRSFGGNIFGLLSPSGRALYILGMTGGYTWARGFWWTIFSATLLHGGLLHILFNMYWVRNLAPTVQEYYGAGRLVVIFTLSGAIGFVLSNVLSGAPTIGASGSIFGLMAALILHGRRTGQAMMTRQLMMVAGMVFMMGFMLPGVNNWAHGGGFAGGWLVAMAMGAGTKRESSAVQLVALACVAVTLLSIVATAFLMFLTLGSQ
jgi:rhomboid protease GluP